VNLIYTGAALLILAQLVGIYALVTHKADLIFAILMGVLLVLAVVIGGIGAYDRIH
jgi:hypothetical protein